MNDSTTWDYADSYRWMEKIGRQNKLVITAAVNGGIQGKEAHDALPERPEEIALQAGEAYDAGASVVHIHARDPQNLANCSGDREVYEEINALVRERCPDIIINNTTGGGFNTTMEDRLRALQAGPEMASLNMGPAMDRFVMAARKPPLEHTRDEYEVDECTPYTYGIIENLAAEMQRLGIKPEMEVYHSGQYWPARSVIDKGLAEPPYVFQFIMGAMTGIFPTPGNVLSMANELPADSLFSVVGIGKFQWHMTTMSIVLGGNVRVGLEDNLYLSKGVKLRGNGEAVEKVVRIAAELSREIASPAEARQLLGLSARPR